MNPVSALKAPRQLGPIRRTPLSRAACAASASSAMPSPPISAKPEEKQSAAFAPFAPASRIACATMGAGTAIRAKSTLPSISSSDGAAASPCTMSRLGFTGISRPAKPAAFI